MQRLTKGRASAVALTTTGVTFRCDRECRIVNLSAAATDADIFVHLEHLGLTDGGTVPANVESFPLSSFPLAIPAFLDATAGFKLYASEAVTIQVKPE